MWGADWAQMFADFDYDDDYGYDLALQGFSLQKSLWRNEFLVCPTHCSVRDSVDDCKYVTRFLERAKFDSYGVGHFRCTCPTLDTIKDDVGAINEYLGLMNVFQVRN
jgi:hypothetical protein